MRKSGLAAYGLAAWMLTGGCKGKANEADAPPPPIPVTPTATASAAAPIAAAPQEIPPAVQPSTNSTARTTPTTPPAAGGPGAPASGAASASKPSNHSAEAAELKNCCSALRKEATGPSQAMYDSAAKTCDTIAGLVAAGRTTHEAALTSLRAALRGGKLPAGCH